MSTDFFSYAPNFRDMDNIGVDPRTGQFIANIPLENIIGNNLLGPEFLLMLSYNPLDSRNQGFGTGFSLGFTQFNKQTSFLELSNGEIHQVEPGTVTIRHHPGREFRFVYTNGEDDADGYTVLWKDGRIEQLKNIDRNSEIFVIAAITSPLGHSIKFEWEWSGQYPLLSRISDQHAILCRMSYSGVFPQMTIWPDTAEAYQITFEIINNAWLDRITFMIPGALGWSFEYDVVDGSEIRLLTGVTHPTGMIEKVEYSQLAGLRFPRGSGRKNLPAVVSYIRIPGAGQPETTIHYQYTSDNFLGGPGQKFGEWSADEDYIYKTLIDYRYGSTEIMTEGGMSVTVVRRYNNYHLQTIETIMSGDDAYQQMYTYYADLETAIADQPPQFQFLRRKQEAWSNKDGIVHSRSTETEFDEFGNLIREVTPLTDEGNEWGTTTVTSWYSADGEVGCPREPNGFVRFMKEQTITPMETDFDAPTTKLQYTYTTLGDTGHAVLDHSSVYSGDVLLGEQAFTYHSEKGGTDFGRIQTISDTKYENGDSSRPYTSKMKINTYILDGKLFQEVRTIGHDAIPSGTLYSQSVYSGRVFHRSDEQGVVTEYKYDRLGRIVSRRDARNTDYENKLTWSYAFKHGNLMVSASKGSVVIKTDMSNNQVRSHFDGSGQIILQERADADAPDKWYEVFRKPDSAQAVKDSMEPLSFADVDEEKKDEPEAGSKIISIPDKRIGKPVTIRRIDSKNEEKSERQYRWDGLARLREETDELGRVTSYVYDDYNRLVKKTLPDNTEINWSYAPHLTGAQIASIHVTGYDGNGSEKTWELGTQKFDSLSRLTERRSGGRTTRYIYNGTSPVPVSILSPSGKEIKYSSIPELSHAISKSDADGVKQTFDYNKLTGNLKTTNAGFVAQMNDWDSRGRLKSEMFFYDNTRNATQYTWRQNGDLSAYRDVTGAEFKLEQNSEGQLSRIVHSDLSVDLTYDDRGRLSTQTVKDQSGSSTLTTALVYDDFDRETRRTLTDNTGTVLTVTQTWTQNDRLASRVTKRNNSIIREEFYEYDIRDRLVLYTAIGDSLPKDAYGHTIRKQHYGYDSLNNHIEMKTVLEDFSEDIAAFSYENRNDPTQLTSITHTHKAYPSTISLAYDAEGRLRRDEAGRVLTYDSMGRLSSVRDETSEDTHLYQYDGFNRLVRQTVYNEDEDLEKEVRDLYYSGDRLVNEVITKESSGVEKRRLIRFGNSYLGVNDGTGLVLTGSDQNGSLLWSCRQGSSEGTVHSWVPYGSKGVDASLPGFNGERIDPVSGVYHLGNGYRSYNPKLMRFTSPDDFSPFGYGGINPYAYCNGDPVNYTDPTGHMSWQAILGITLGVIGIAVTAGVASIAIISAGEIMAALSLTSATTLAVGGLGVAADVAAIASGATEDTNPQASSILGWVSLGMGVAGIATGIGVGIAGFLKLRRTPSLSQANLPSAAEEIGLVNSKGGMRNIDLIEDGIYTFTDTYKGGNRLNIDAHGKMVDISSRMVIGKQPNGMRYLDVQELAGWLKNRYNLNAYDNLRTISCYSGNGGQSSFAARLSKATGKPVKGYISIVSSNIRSEDITELFRQAGTRQVYKAYQDYFASEKFYQIAKTNPYMPGSEQYYRWSYRPVKFNPS